MKKKKMKKMKKKTNREEKPADVFLTDFCSHNIESRRVIVSSSERWKNIIIPILKDASDPAGLGLLGRVRPDGSLASILAPPSVSDLPRRHVSNTCPLKFQIRRLTGLSRDSSLSITFLSPKVMHFKEGKKKFKQPWVDYSRIDSC